MSGVVARCLGAVLGALALQMAALLLASSVLGTAIDMGLVLRLGCVLPLAGVAAYLVLSPLRADLRALQHLASETTDDRTPSPMAAARTLDAAPLLESVALLSSRSSELEGTAAAARGAAIDTERLRTSFVAAMAHDLRGPLNAITGFSDLLVMEKHDVVAPAQRASVDIIRRAAQDLLVLLDQILDWAKLEAGQIELDRAPVPFEGLLYEAADEAKQRSADRGLSVTLDVEDALPNANVDAVRVKQALLGLMDHATRLTDKPRVALSACVRANEAGHPCVRVEVKDPQLVVREADQAGFFEAFRPSYAPSGRRVAGLGLGPALARALIQAHGGSVWFASRTDTGTTFTLELPL